MSDQTALGLDELRLTYTLALAIGRAPDVPAAVEVVLKTLSDAGGWAVSTAWQPNRAGTLLEFCPPGYSRIPLGGEFLTESAHFTFARGVGLPGRVWQSGHPAWVRDVSRDSNYPRHLVAERTGLKT